MDEQLLQCVEKKTFHNGVKPHVANPLFKTHLYLNGNPRTPDSRRTNGIFGSKNPQSNRGRKSLSPTEVVNASFEQRA